MSTHNMPRLCAATDIMARTDLTQKEKEEKIDALEESFLKLYKKYQKPMGLDLRRDADKALISGIKDYVIKSEKDKK